MSPLCHRFIIKIFGSEYFRIFYSANWTCHKVANSLMDLFAVVAVNTNCTVGICMLSGWFEKHWEIFCI